MSNLVLRDDGGNDQLTVSDIPKGVLDRFQTVTREQYPDYGGDAWAAVLAEFVQSYVDPDTVPLHIDGIPRDKMDKANAVCESAGIRFDGVISRVILAAGDGKLHMISHNEADTLETAGHAIVYIGYPDQLMEVLSQFAESQSISAEEMIARAMITMGIPNGIKVKDEVDNG